MAYRLLHNDHPDRPVIVIANFSGHEQTGYPLPLPGAETWNVRFNSDRKAYDDAFGDIKAPTIEVNAGKAGGTAFQSMVNIGAFSALILTQN